MKRPDMPIENRSKQEWESRYAITLWDWFFKTKNTERDDFDAFVDKEWSQQVDSEEPLSRAAG